MLESKRKSYFLKVYDYLKKVIFKKKEAKEDLNQAFNTQTTIDKLAGDVYYYK